MSDDDKLREQLVEVEALRIRLERELELWGTLTARIKDWAETGVRLRENAEETVGMIRESMREWRELRDSILDNIEDPADWWKRGEDSCSD